MRRTRCGGWWRGQKRDKFDLASLMVLAAGEDIARAGADSRVSVLFPDAISAEVDCR